MEIIFVAVKTDCLPKLPPAVHAFVMDYFSGDINTIFGTECLTAICSDALGSRADFSSRGDTLNKNGVPRIQMYASTPEYKEGLDLVKYPFGAVSWLLTEAGNNQFEGIYSRSICILDN